MRAFAVAVLVVAALTACKKSGGVAADIKPAVPPIKVQTVAATEAPAPDVLTLTGTVAADYRSDVTADTQGKVINVMIERGQRVKLGQPVVQLDVRTAALNAREAQANLASARAQKELADQECDRTKTLLGKGAITQDEYDRQMTSCRAAQEQVSATQARTEMMSKSVADGLVRAPFDGVVAERDVSPGEWVAPGKALFTLVKDDPLKIELSVPEAAVTAVKLGERVEVVAVAHEDKTYGAAISRIGAEIGRTRALIVEAQLDKGSDLYPGMFAEAHVVIGQTPHVVLPDKAVVKRGKQWHAFIVKNGEALDSIVQLGTPPAAGQVTIIQGVAKGDKVVAAVPENLADGSKVVE
ncbi:MAG TPA: efflux RND transporter periplasmic adaptor subunit [Kofleriaceae bacterium]|jgi:membrane fusion protein (multidrug efflux system)